MLQIAPPPLETQGKADMRGRNQYPSTSLSIFSAVIAAHFAWEVCLQNPSWRDGGRSGAEKTRLGTDHRGTLVAFKYSTILRCGLLANVLPHPHPKPRERSQYPEVCDRRRLNLTRHRTVRPNTVSADHCGCQLIYSDYC
jgi:hypothetical protein